MILSARTNHEDAHSKETAMSPSKFSFVTRCPAFSCVRRRSSSTLSSAQRAPTSNDNASVTLSSHCHVRMSVGEQLHSVMCCVRFSHVQMTPRRAMCSEPTLRFVYGLMSDTQNPWALNVFKTHKTNWRMDEHDPIMA